MRLQTRDEMLAEYVAKVGYAWNQHRFGRITQTQLDAKLADLDRRAQEANTWYERNATLGANP